MSDTNTTAAPVEAAPVEQTSAPTTSTAPPDATTGQTVETNTAPPAPEPVTVTLPEGVEAKSVIEAINAGDKAAIAKSFESWVADLGKAYADQVAEFRKQVESRPQYAEEKAALTRLVARFDKDGEIAKRLDEDPSLGGNPWLWETLAKLSALHREDTAIGLQSGTAPVKPLVFGTPEYAAAVWPDMAKPNGATNHAR